MKNLIFIFGLALAGLTVCFAPACKTPPDQRVAAVQTLQTIGATVDASMKVAAQLYHDGRITAAQWGKIADLHDKTFQPAYNLAVKAVQANLSSLASPDLQNIATQLLTLIASYQ